MYFIFSRSIQFLSLNEPSIRLRKNKMQLRNAQKISSRFQKISEGKVIDNEVFRAKFLN